MYNFPGFMTQLASTETALKMTIFGRYCKSTEVMS